MQLRFAVHRTRYDKEVLTIAGIRTEGVSKITLYNTSAIVSLTDRTAAAQSVLIESVDPITACGVDLPDTSRGQLQLMKPGMLERRPS